MDAAVVSTITQGVTPSLGGMPARDSPRADLHRPELPSALTCSTVMTGAAAVRALTDNLAYFTLENSACAPSKLNSFACAEGVVQQGQDRTTATPLRTQGMRMTSDNPQPWALGAPNHEQQSVLGDMLKWTQDRLQAQLAHNQQLTDHAFAMITYGKTQASLADATTF